MGLNLSPPALPSPQSLTYSLTNSVVTVFHISHSSRGGKESKDMCEEDRKGDMKKGEKVDMFRKRESKEKGEKEVALG